MPANPCPTCGACCRSYWVTLCGRDIWGIARSENLAPSEFVVPRLVEGPRVDGVQFAAGGPISLLMLDKRGRIEADRPCVFLVSLGTSHAACGIYGHRPVVCRDYPFVVRDGSLALRERALCPANAWPTGLLAAVGPERVLHSHREFDLYGAFVARWNARVAATPARAFRLDELFESMIDVYDYAESARPLVGGPTVSEWPDVRSGPAQIEDAATWETYRQHFIEALDRLLPQP